MKSQSSRTIWREVPLGEVLPLKYGKARGPQCGYARKGTKTYGSNGAFGEFDRALTEKPAIIVGRKGAAGAVHYSPEPCWPIDTAYYTEGSDETHLPFFRYLLESLSLGSLDRSTAIPSLSRDDYDVRKIAFPPSKDEQRLIVAEIEKQFTRLDAGVAALRRVHANLKRYRAAVLKAACEGRLVPTEAEIAKNEGRTFETGEQLLQRILAGRRKNWTGRRTYEEPSDPAATGFPKLPEGWKFASLEALTSAARPICYGILMPKENVSGGILYVKVRDMRGDKIDLDGLQRTAHEIAAKYARASLRTGDILLSIRGTYGRVAEVPKELNGGNITQDTARLDVSGLVDHRFVATCLRAPDVQNYFKRVARGVAVKGVNIGDVRPTPIALPPFTEQGRIVAEVERRLSVIDELEAVVGANLVKGRNLRQSILGKVFSNDHVQSSSQDIVLKPTSKPSVQDYEAKHVTTKRRTTMRSSTKHPPSLERLLDLLDDYDGAAPPDQLLVALQLTEDVETFFDLLRIGQERGVLGVPIGESGNIQRIRK